MGTATITLTADQVASVIAQAATNPLPPTPPQVPPTPPAPPAGGPVPPGSVNVIIPWAPGTTRGYTGPIDSTAIICVQFTTGPSPSAANNLPHIVGAEYQAPPRTRIAVLSATPGDFGPQPMAGASSNGNTVQVPFTVANPNNFGYYPVLEPNTTYYLNVKSANSADNPELPANMAFDLIVPA